MSKLCGLKHFSLFTGIGGIDLAAEWAGFETVGQCEWADYPTKVLEKHWPDVPRWRDIRDVTLESVRDRGIQSVDIISGGFPCQPFSVAGKRKGKDDDRYLWPEMLRVISELKPTWVVGENVNGFVNMGLEDACIDLENEGYGVQPFVIPACSVGAWHERKRVFIVAYSNDTNRGTSAVFQNARCELFEGTEQLGALSNETGEGNANIIKRPSEVVLNPTGKRWQKSNNETRNISERETEWESWAADSFNRYIWESEPNVGRVANGVPSRVDRLKCLGNAVVPQQVYPILKAIAEIERGGVIG